MNTPTNENHPPASDHAFMLFGSMRVARARVFIGMLALLIILLGLTLMLSQPINEANTRIHRYAWDVAFQTKHQTGIHVYDTEELLELLDKYDLLTDQEISEVPLVIVVGLPKNFHELTDMATRKKAFLHTLLPPALLALEEVKKERKRLLNILSKMERPVKRLVFSDVNGDWASRLTGNEIEFVLKLKRKYHSSRAQELLSRVDVVPVSLILGQGAIESSWGGSRFARKGNNIFGIWTWGEQGIIPADRGEGKKHKVKIYRSLLDSVRAYLLTLNRVKAYSHFRKLRKQTSDSLILAAGLLYYSERREGYVQNVRQIINSNNLQQYDNVRLVKTRAVPEELPYRPSSFM
jgi:Bax protein